MEDITLNWEPRAEQILVVSKFIKLIELNKKFLVAEMPTGVGKSYAIQMMARHVQELNPSAKFDILTNTKILQDQYISDFSYLRSLKGKENYICTDHEVENCSVGQELIASGEEVQCYSCPYKIAKKEYMESSVGVLNFNLFLSLYCNNPAFIDERNAKILFIDEAHLFEETYSHYVECFISTNYLASLGLEVTKETENRLKTITTIKQFALFIEQEVNELIRQQNSKLNQQLEICVGKNKKQTLLKKIKNISFLQLKINRFLDDNENWSNNWILNKEITTDGTVLIKAKVIWGTNYLPQLWEKYDHIVLLSGTILDRVMFCKIMNIDLTTSSFLSLESPFEAEKRKIVYSPIGKMNFEGIEENYHKLLKKTIRIVRENIDYKGIIHTGNYKVSNWLKRDLLQIEDLKDKFIFHDSTDRETALNNHIESEKKTVLVSPSMVNGVDLKGDLARFQVLMKIPYPSMADEQIKRRMESNETWYGWKTLCDVIQLCGRSTRSKDDWSVTHILDSNFSNLIHRNKLPKYIKDSIENE
jgi:ATP-dependent DNA helicase DinG